MLAGTSFGKEVKVRGKTLSEILNSTKYQANLEQGIIKLVKLALFEFFDLGMDFKEKTRPMRKTRKVGRPKRIKSVGRPKQYQY